MCGYILKGPCLREPKYLTQSTIPPLLAAITVEAGETARSDLVVRFCRERTQRRLSPRQRPSLCCPMTSHPSCVWITMQITKEIFVANRDSFLRSIPAALLPSSCRLPSGLMSQSSWLLQSGSASCTLQSQNFGGRRTSFFVDKGAKRQESAFKLVKLPLIRCAGQQSGT